MTVPNPKRAQQEIQYQNGRNADEDCNRHLRLDSVVINILIPHNIGEGSGGETLQ
jgi:hypothetical protein